MNIPSFQGSEVMNGVLFFMAMLPFIIIRLGSAVTVATSPSRRTIPGIPRCLLVGSALGVMMLIPPVMTASAEEVYVIFTESGPELYKVDTLQEANLTQHQYDSLSWPKAGPNLRMDQSIFVTLIVKNHMPVLVPGFQAASSIDLGHKSAGIDKQVPGIQEEFEKQVAMSPRQIYQPTLPQTQRLVRQDNPQTPLLMPN